MTKRVLIYIGFYTLYYIFYKLMGFEQTMLCIGVMIIGDLTYKETRND